MELRFLKNACKRKYDETAASGVVTPDTYRPGAKKTIDLNNHRTGATTNSDTTSNARDNGSKTSELLSKSLTPTRVDVNSYRISTLTKVNLISNNSINKSSAIAIANQCNNDINKNNVSVLTDNGWKNGAEPFFRELMPKNKTSFDDTCNENITNRYHNPNEIGASGVKLAMAEASTRSIRNAPNCNRTMNPSAEFANTTAAGQCGAAPAIPEEFVDIVGQLRATVGDLRYNNIKLQQQLHELQQRQQHQQQHQHQYQYQYQEQHPLPQQEYDQLHKIRMHDNIRISIQHHEQYNNVVQNSYNPGAFFNSPSYASYQGRINNPMLPITALHPSLSPGGQLRKPSVHSCDATGWTKTTPSRLEQEVHQIYPQHQQQPHPELMKQDPFTSHPLSRVQYWQQSRDQARRQLAVPQQEFEQKVEPLQPSTTSIVDIPPLQLEESYHHGMTFDGDGGLTTCEVIAIDQDYTNNENPKKATNRSNKNKKNNSSPKRYNANGNNHYVDDHYLSFTGMVGESQRPNSPALKPDCFEQVCVDAGHYTEEDQNISLNGQMDHNNITLNGQMDIGGIVSDLDSSIRNTGNNSSSSSSQSNSSNLSDSKPMNLLNESFTSSPSKQVKFRAYQAENWTERFEDLLRFCDENGHCLVPNFYPQNPLLAQWTKRQRYQYKLKMEGKRSTITEERVQTLEEVGFVWDSHKAVWEERLEELKQFKEEFKHCNVPSRYKRNHQLAIWVKRQRRQQKSKICGLPNCMTDEREEALDKIGFVWDMKRGTQKKKSKFFTN